MLQCSIILLYNQLISDNHIYIMFEDEDFTINLLKEHFEFRSSL